MTNQELQKALSKFPDLPVMITWESVTQGITFDNIYVSKDGTLLIDADENFYKEDFMSGRKRTKPKGE